MWGRSNNGRGMKCAEITDVLIDAVRSGKYRYLRVNYANGDMVGHTGNFEAAITAMQGLDLQLARLIPVILAAKGTAIITADHGNADEMYELDKKGNVISNTEGRTKAKTSHTLNPVPFILISGKRIRATNYAMICRRPACPTPAATILNLLASKHRRNTMRV